MCTLHQIRVERWLLQFGASMRHVIVNADGVQCHPQEKMFVMMLYSWPVKSLVYFGKSVRQMKSIKFAHISDTRHPSVIWLVVAATASTFTCKDRASLKIFYR